LNGEDRYSRPASSTCSKVSTHEEDLAGAGVKLNWEFREAAEGVRYDVNASSMRYSIKKPMSVRCAFQRSLTAALAI
jgi:hypothetical protein